MRRVGRHRRWTGPEEVLVVQLTNVSALPLSGSAWIGRSVACNSSVRLLAPLLLAGRLGRRDHRRLPATERVEVLEVPLGVLSGPTVLMTMTCRSTLLFASLREPALASAAFEAHAPDRGPS